MRKCIDIVLMVSLTILFLASCDGGSGNGKGELNVYDVLINIEAVEGIDAECPGTADLKLSLRIEENKISGFAELFGIVEIGPKSDILGVAKDGDFSLQPFRVTVVGGTPNAQFPPQDVHSILPNL